MVKVEFESINVITNFSNFEEPLLKRYRNKRYHSLEVDKQDTLSLLKSDKRKKVRFLIFTVYSYFISFKFSFVTIFTKLL